MSLADLDTGAISRALSHYAERSQDRVEAFFERGAVAELLPEGSCRRRLRRDEGLAIRLLRDGRAWLASRDGIDGAGLAEALRRVARVHPRTAPPVLDLDLSPPPELLSWSELEAFSSRVELAIRRQHAAFELQLTVREHRRDLQVVGPQLVNAMQSEHFFSCRAELAWGRWGTLLPALDDAEAERLASVLTSWFRGRTAAPPESCRARVLLGPAAVAVLLHEAVAHALEVDTLAATGDPAAAIGVQLAVPELSVLDDPGAGPMPRSSDDEGTPVLRRWLLRQGVVEQLLADRRWSDCSERLLPGAARRSHRHVHPGPRSSFLELISGDASEDDLLAATEDGLFLAEAARGSLEPHSGRFELELNCGRRIRKGTLAEPVGPCRLVGRVPELLAGVVAVGRDATTAGAGWCAKGGQMLPVWAAAPMLVLADVEVVG